jgi:hypothetical protein
VGDDPPDQPDPQRLRGVDDPAGEEELGGVPAPDQLGQAPEAGDVAAQARFTNSSPKRARSEAMRTSATNASSTPQPMAAPSTAATTGTSVVSRASAAGVMAGADRMASDDPVTARTCFTSSP